MSISHGKKIASAAVVAGFGLASLVTAPASAGNNATLSTPPGGKITIDVVTANGTGCPPGSTAVAMSPDNQAMTMSFSEYVAESGKGISPRNARKNCQLMLNLNVPSGFSYGIVQVDYRGYANIAKGATGYQQANYYFQGNSANMKTYSPLRGPIDKDYTFTDKLPVQNVVWSPCGEKKLLAINTVLRIDKGSSGNAYSYLSNDSTDVSVATKYHFAWKRC